ncbi:hypothetical protein [Streptomyces sp. NPDC008150]|uniref:hypothetical protein n=1 Tax=Streptomyces sp. NPDC008150 TaxID=3364816 RepID=UPI0036EE3F85
MPSAAASASPALVTGRDLAAATGAATELEEVCALLLLLGESERRLLEPAEIAELTAKYGSFWDL